jgi:4-aminobutyrate aminotransferase-like enzyme
MSYFTNSGSEANETAIVAAQTYTDNREIVALRHAYSGRTSLTMSVTAHSTWKSARASARTSSTPSIPTATAARSS